MIIGLQSRQFNWFVLVAGLIQVAAFYFSGALVNGPGHLAVPQSDTLLYCQAARRIVELHPFSFSVGTAASTGTTSVLYPFLLAIPYALGFVGSSLFCAGFVLNALFYLLFLAGWNRAFASWLQKDEARFASLMLCLCPHPAFCALAQSDIGCWMALTGLFFWALASARTGLYSVLLMVSPWVRPEGLVLIVAFLIIAAWGRKRRDLSVGVLALVSVAGVYALNWYLTGNMGFSSIANKGHFKGMVLADAVVQTACDFIVVLRSAFLSDGLQAPRMFYAVPVLGLVAVLAGFVLCLGKARDRSMLVALLALFGTTAVVAQSGWQGFSMDRYLAWVMPVSVGLGACGWLWAAKVAKNGLLSSLAIAVPVLYAVFANVVMLCYFNGFCEASDRMYGFGRDIDRILPTESSLGGFGLAGFAYSLGDRRMAHLSAIYSPEFAFGELECVYEILKNEPDTRFDYWCFESVASHEKEMQKVAGPIAILGPGAVEVRLADWRAFDAAAVVPKVDGHRLVDRVDVGYEKDEIRSEYQIVYSYAMRPFSPVVKVDDLQGRRIVDVGRLVVGYDEMRVENLVPGKDLLIVMRTRNEVHAIERYGMHRSADYVFDDHLDLHASVDGVEKACCHVDVGESGFTDVVMRIPGQFITEKAHKIGINGDHVAFGYWFYQ